MKKQCSGKGRAGDALENGVVKKSHSFHRRDARSSGEGGNRIKGPQLIGAYKKHAMILKKGTGG